MKNCLIILLFVFIRFEISAQTTPVDLGEVKSFAKSTAYQQLFKRFLANDTTLKVADYVHLYYGQAYQANYAPNARHDSAKALNLYFRKAKDAIDFKKVVSYTEMILKDNPFDLEQIYTTSWAYEKSGALDQSKMWFYKYDQLIRAIMSSGDGKTEETAFVVIRVADEYAMLKAFGFKFTGQALISKNKKKYDLMNLGKNQYGIEKLYFDIDLFFGKW